jgi:hypothetical protein
MEMDVTILEWLKLDMNDLVGAQLLQILDIKFIEETEELKLEKPVMMATSLMVMDVPPYESLKQDILVRLMHSIQIYAYQIEGMESEMEVNFAMMEII